MKLKQLRCCGRIVQSVGRFTAGRKVAEAGSILRFLKSLDLRRSFDDHVKWRYHLQYVLVLAGDSGDYCVYCSRQEPITRSEQLPH